MTSPAIIIVEDNPDNLYLLKALVKETVELPCKTFTTGRSFWQFMEQYPASARAVHLILLDLQLPGEDGYAILARIRQFPHLAQAQVAACTANVLPTDVTRCHLAGFDGLIGKPIDMDRFPIHLRALLAGERIWAP